MKPTDLKCRPQVAAVIGEAYADHELQRVINDNNCEKGDYFETGFHRDQSPQGGQFWGCISAGENPYEHGHEKPELSVPESKTGDREALVGELYIGLTENLRKKYSKKEKEATEEAENAMDKERSDVLTNKYKVLCKGVEIDVYDVLMAYSVTNPADQHAIKKMLMPGKRGVKDANQDRREAIQSLERAIELAQSDK